MTAPSERRRGGFWFVWRAPLVLAVFTLFGLLAALLGTGGWHWAAWLALSAPVAMALWFGCRPSSRAGGRARTTSSPSSAR